MNFAWRPHSRSSALYHRPREAGVHDAVLSPAKEGENSKKGGFGRHAALASRGHQAEAWFFKAHLFILITHEWLHKLLVSHEIQ